MGKLPAILLLAIAVWIGWTLYQEGPDEAFGGLFSMLYEDEHGDNAPATRSGAIADEILQRADEEAGRRRGGADPDEDWWAR